MLLQIFDLTRKLLRNQIYVVQITAFMLESPSHGE